MFCSNKWILSTTFFTIAGLSASTFPQQIRTFYTTAHGLSENAVSNLTVVDGTVYAQTGTGWSAFEGEQWKKAAAPRASRSAPPGLTENARQVVFGPGGRAAAAAMGGLYEHTGNKWERLFPRDGARSWAPYDVRAVAYDAAGNLHFASAQGVGVREQNVWKLFDISDGLPYDDFTSIAPAQDGSVWYGTRMGAIRRIGNQWEYRQGKRWLPDDAVNAVVVDGTTAWLATPAGVARIEQRPMTLAEKARFFESEIDKRHRRTEHEYVLGVQVAKPGDASEWTQHDSDNDGLWTAMYGAGESFACAAKVSDEACRRAKKAFEALRFLGQVTQGGSHPAPKGYVARTVLPASQGNPNTVYTPERDRKTRASRDGLWKIMDPRWPLSADGRWYWKSDTSSDELDGHYFLYALYFDLVASTESERQRVREHVAALTDHLLEHNFQLIDHDGKVTRWGVFNPEALNRDLMWWEERGLNSLSMLSYLKTAEHITGDRKYAAAAEKLREKHGYDLNTLIAKSHAGAGSGNQSDDEMAFMCLYNLMKYERDPRLRMIYGLALRQRWEMEEAELNPLFNYIAAVGLAGVEFVEPPNRTSLAVEGSWKEDSLETLRRYPLDRFNWGLKNSHRKDIVALPRFVQGGKEQSRGHLRNGRVLPIDERYVEHWNHDPWALNYSGDGRRLADGASFLLPYYMGLYHGFLDN